MSIAPEFSEAFEKDGLRFDAIFTNFDEKAVGFEPGRLTRVIRLLISDEDAAALKKGDVIRRLRSGETFVLKPLKMSGMGLVEIDLHPHEGGSVERIF
jgi:hypothetical protein